MAESGSYNLGLRFDMKQILLEARHRWLRPAEICEILRNYHKFHISAEAPNKPVTYYCAAERQHYIRFIVEENYPPDSKTTNLHAKSSGFPFSSYKRLTLMDMSKSNALIFVFLIGGSVFLFDRKVLRYFRKDGHNWRKKKDGKIVREAHEKLKVGSVDMLHCYYAHGEDNELFQRRSYWLLEPDLMHIVFVHYLDVNDNKTYISSTAVSSSKINSSLSSSFHGTGPSSTLSSAYEDAESGLSVEDNHQASSRFHSYPGSPLTDESHFAQSSLSNPLSNPGEVANRQGTDCSLPVQANWENPTMNQNLVLSSPRDHENNLFEDKSHLLNQGNDVETFFMLPDKQKEQLEKRNLQMPLLDTETGNAADLDLENSIVEIGGEHYPFLLKKPLISGLQNDESLKKVDSFSRWIAKEFGETDELNLQSSNSTSWGIIGSDYDSSMPLQLQMDTDTLNPSIPQNQLFSIYEVSPNWAYADFETKVLITGKFLRTEHELSNCKWSIMFGQVEVTADFLADGILCCEAPPHKPGTVPFYVTCSNRLACSEIREFEYRLSPYQNMSSRAVHGDSAFVMHICHQFEMMLSLAPIGSCSSSAVNDFEKQNVVSKIVSLKEEESNRERNVSENDPSEFKVIGEMLLEQQLREKFFSWLLHRVTEDGKGLTILDEGGQGVLHLAAALGFNWALKPIIASGISIDFRDADGWTALHWAACCGREDTVAGLVSLGAAPGALTDPSAEYPLGRTPADLASSSGHKGISGFLAETSLTTHLSTLEVNDPQEDGSTEVAGVKAIDTVSERLAVPTTDEDVPDTLSLKDSLAAVRNATQAASRIHQIFRVQSFQRKQFTECDGNEFLIPDEQAVSFVAAKTSRLGHSSGGASTAAVHIQKKFRGWKKRKEFLCIREKVVKIQAHFRGHQARKKYKPIVWSVGILEKVILRWRRKGSGLRGFRSDAVLKGPDIQGTVPQEDDYDFLKEGRKQTEERMQKALARVNSMAQYPEARAQYRRLLTAAKGFRETKASSCLQDATPENIEDKIYTEEELIDIESLLDDDTFMSLMFE